MTHDQVLALLAPILSALVLGVASMLTIVLTFGTARLRAWLDSKNQAAASAVVADASARMQAGMQNAAGRLALGIQVGTIDPTNMASVQRAAMTEATSLAAKLPDAVATLRPLEGAILDGILGKLGSMSAPVITAPADGGSQPRPTPAA